MAIFLVCFVMVYMSFFCALLCLFDEKMQEAPENLEKKKTEKKEKEKCFLICFEEQVIN